MTVDILMPALSPTMEEGTLAKWLVKEGDSVASGDVIAEIETDKATMEVEAVDEGVIAQLLVAEGTEGVAVNAVIAVLVEEGEEPAAASSAASAPATAPAPAAEAAPETAPKTAAETTPAVAQAPIEVAQPEPEWDGSSEARLETDEDWERRVLGGNPFGWDGDEVRNLSRRRMR